MVATAVKLSEKLVKEARKYADIYNRSVPKQIEYWAKIGKIAEENPDLPNDFIKDLLLTEQQQDETPLFDFGCEEISKS